MVLKHEADRTVAEVGKLRLREGERVGAVEADGAAGRPVERAEQVQERALAGAGRAHDGERLAAVEAERHVTEDGERAAPCRVVFAELFDLKGHRTSLACASGSKSKKQPSLARRAQRQSASTPRP